MEAGSDVRVGAVGSVLACTGLPARGVCEYSGGGAGSVRSVCAHAEAQVAPLAPLGSIAPVGAVAAVGAAGAATTVVTEVTVVRGGLEGGAASLPAPITGAGCLGPGPLGPLPGPIALPGTGSMLRIEPNTKCCTIGCLPSTCHK